MSINWSDEHIRAHFPESDWLAENSESNGGRVLQFPRKGNGVGTVEGHGDSASAARRQRDAALNIGYKSEYQASPGSKVILWAAVLCSPLVILGVLWWVKS